MTTKIMSPAQLESLKEAVKTFEDRSDSLWEAWMESCDRIAEDRVDGLGAARRNQLFEDFKVARGHYLKLREKHRVAKEAQA